MDKRRRGVLRKVKVMPGRTKTYTHYPMVDNLMTATLFVFFGVAFLKLERRDLGYLGAFMAATAMCVRVCKTFFDAICPYIGATKALLSREIAASFPTKDGSSLSTRA